MGMPVRASTRIAGRDVSAKPEVQCSLAQNLGQLGRVLGYPAEEVLDWVARPPFLYVSFLLQCCTSCAVCRSSAYLTVASQRPEHSCIKAGCIPSRCERADPPNGVTDRCQGIHSTTLYSPALDQNHAKSALSDFANYPRTAVQLSCSTE